VLTNEKILFAYGHDFVSRNDTFGSSRRNSWQGHNRAGQAIGSIRVTVTDKAGTVISSSITNADGAYEIKGVAPDRYEIELLPLTGGSLGGLTNVPVGPHGSKVDLILIERSPGFVLSDSAQRNA
jgi:hypothetical protein